MACGVSAVPPGVLANERSCADDRRQLSAALQPSARTRRCATGGGVAGTRNADLQPGSLRVPLAAAEVRGRTAPQPSSCMVLKARRTRSTCRQRQQAVARGLQRHPHEHAQLRRLTDGASRRRSTTPGLSSRCRPCSALLHLEAREPAQSIALIGYSMGGNLVLKLAGDLGATRHRSCRALSACSPAVDLAARRPTHCMTVAKSHSTNEVSCALFSSAFGARLCSFRVPSIRRSTRKHQLPARLRRPHHGALLRVSVRRTTTITALPRHACSTRLLCPRCCCTQLRRPVRPLHTGRNTQGHRCQPQHHTAGDGARRPLRVPRHILTAMTNGYWADDGCGLGWTHTA